MVRQLNENNEISAKDITGWAVEYRDMTTGHRNLICFEDVLDAESCENDFYTIEDFDPEDEEFWIIFNHHKIVGDVVYENIDWRRDIEKVTLKGHAYNSYKKGNELWVIINNVPFDFYL